MNAQFADGSEPFSYREPHSLSNSRQHFVEIRINLTPPNIACASIEETRPFTVRWSERQEFLPVSFAPKR